MPAMWSTLRSSLIRGVPHRQRASSLFYPRGLMPPKQTYARPKAPEALGGQFKLVAYRLPMVGPPRSSVPPLARSFSSLQGSSSNRQRALHNHPTMSHPRIAIAGAGPAGLTLARILHLAGIPFTVYELDPSKEHRYEQGGRFLFIFSVIFPC